MCSLGWYPLCTVDPTPLIQVLDDLDWLPGGAGPGQFGMIDDLPLSVMEAAASTIKRCIDCFPDHRHKGMTVFSKLVPSQHIEPHRDGHDGHCDTRIHVPLTTNPGAVVVIAGGGFHMEVGMAYVIDPREIHSVTNAGDTDRIHLIFNAVR